MLLELAHDFGLHLKKTSNSKGGEYHSACPSCGEGFDRFLIWPEINRYWCRRCGVKGDAIQFCRDFMGLSFREACERVNKTLNFFSGRFQQIDKGNKCVLKSPSVLWKEKASVLVDWSNKKLGESTDMKNYLRIRGFKDSTLSQFQIGYCVNLCSNQTKDFYRSREEWGLVKEYKENGKEKSFWIPHGLVIPTHDSDGSIIKIKIRRQSWQTGDPLPKYVELSGSKQTLSTYGKTEIKVALILESELDSILIQQEAAELCFCIALGGATKRPDIETDYFLSRCSLILWSLDNDEAGRKEALWWRKEYPQLRFWPSPMGKSPGDAFQYHSLNLHEWIKAGISQYRASVLDKELSSNTEKQI